jgi:hypothetical protein
MGNAWTTWYIYSTESVLQHSTVCISISSLVDADDALFSIGKLAMANDQKQSSYCSKSPVD